INCGRNSVTAAVSAVASVMLSLCSGTPGSSRPARPDDRSSRTATSSPLACHASVTWEPMKPAPPATTTRIGDDPRRKTEWADGLCQRPDTRPCRAAGREWSAQLNYLSVGGQRDLAVERHLGSLRQGPRPVVPGHQVGQYEPSHAGRGGVLHRLPG